MSTQNVVVLDANVLIRACLGVKVLRLIERFKQSASFYSPEICFLEAGKHLPTILHGRGVDIAAGLSVLQALRPVVHGIDVSVYREQEPAARKRISDRDPTDWHVVAAALFLKCPIWTEDQDFFGVGVPTWTTNRVEIYLSDVGAATS